MRGEQAIREGGGGRGPYDEDRGTLMIYETAVLLIGVELKVQVLTFTGKKGQSEGQWS